MRILSVYGRMDDGYTERKNGHMESQLKFNTVRFGFRSFKYNGAMLYNKLPPVFKELSLPNFKSNVQSWKPAGKCGACLICVL